MLDGEDVAAVAFGGVPAVRCEETAGVSVGRGGGGVGVTFLLSPPLERSLDHGFSSSLDRLISVRDETKIQYREKPCLRENTAVAGTRIRTALAKGKEPRKDLSQFSTSEKILLTLGLYTERSMAFSSRLVRTPMDPRCFFLLPAAPRFRRRDKSKERAKAKKGKQQGGARSRSLSPKP